MQTNLNMWHIGALLVVVSIISQTTEARKDERECEVCIAVLQKFKDGHSESVITDVAKSERAFKTFCKDKKGKENRFCYFIGGTEDAATGMLSKISKPLSFFMPVQKICEKLKTDDSQICELRYDKKADFSQLEKLRVNELKKILSNWGEDNACKGCAEKSDFVKKIRELLPKHDPEEYKKLQQKREL